MLYSYPSHELSRDMVIQKIYARLSLNDRTMLDPSCDGSYMPKTTEFKWDLLERIKRNSEDWGSDNGKESGMTPKLIVLNLLWIPMLFVDLVLSMDLTLR